MASGSDTTEGASVVQRVVGTLLGGAEPGDHEQLVAEARERYDEDTPFAATLERHVAGRPDDLRAREALLILCLARPSLGLGRGLDPLVEGRSVASALVAAGELQRAEHVLGLLYRRHSEDGELERERVSLARRTGGLEALVDQHLQRAEEFTGEGRVDDAVQHLRKALLLAPGRREIATRIRALKPASRVGRGFAWPSRGALAILALVSLVGLLARREHGVRGLYQHLPEARAGERASLEQRRAALAELMGDYPLWHGMFAARSEHRELDLELEVLERDEQLANTRSADEQRFVSLAEVEMALVRARAALQADALEESIAQYELALRIAPPGWESAQQARKDLEAVRAYMIRRGAGGSSGE